MTVSVRTRHTTDDYGRDVTVHTVVLEDAAGKQTEYPFQVSDGGHEYVGDGEPSERASDAIDAWEASSSVEEFKSALSGETVTEAS